MDLFEMAEKLRQHTGVTFEEAKAALEKCQGDMLDAAILLEQQGKTKTGGSSLRTAPERKPAEVPAEPIITEQEETKNEPS